jgi:hypothetical protein
MLNFKSKIKFMAASIAAFGLSSVAVANEDVSAENFVEAHKSVVEVQQKYMPQMQQAETQKQLEDLQSQAQVELISAIEDSGITVDEYNWVVNNYEDDPELKKNLEEAFKNSGMTK